MNLSLMSEVISIKDKLQLVEKLELNNEVLLAISEDWCSVCRTMDGTIINAAYELKDKAIVLKSNIETSQTLVTELNLRSVPAYVLYHQGKVVDILYGRQTIQRLTQLWQPE